MASSVYQMRSWSEQVMSDRMSREDRDRAQESARGWAYYDGDMPPQLRVKPGDYDDNVLLEYPKLIIDTSVAFLFGDNVKFTAQDPEGPIQNLVDAAWGTEEQKMVALQRLGINGAVCGHEFIKLSPLDDGTVKVRVIDPSYVDVDWATDDYSRVLGYTIEWSGWDDALQKTVHYRQEITLLDPEGQGPWNVVDSRSVGSGNWIVVDEELWDFPFAPIVDAQNLPTANEFYGKPDIDDTGLDLCDRINMAASNIQKILRYHAHPKVFVYGYSGKELDMSVDKAVNFPSIEARVDTLGMPTDLAAAFSMMDRLTNELLRVTRTPLAALGDPSASYAASSGLALKLAFMPLVDKTSQKRQTFGFLLNEVNQRIQAIAGLEPEEVELEWPGITPDDPQAEAQTALMRQQVGIAKSTTIAELGYDPDVEAEKRQEEESEATEAMQRAMEQGAFAPQSRVATEDVQGAPQAQMDRRSRDMLEGR